MARVALIEDDAFFSEDLVGLLSSAGHECSVYSTAASVVEKLEDVCSSDVVILDLMIPRVAIERFRGDSRDTGEILFEMIRRKRHDLPVLVVSARDQGSISVGLRADKFVPLIVTKPPDNDALDRILSVLSKGGL